MNLIPGCFPCLFTEAEHKLAAASSSSPPTATATDNKKIITNNKRQPSLRYNINWSHIKLTKPPGHLQSIFIQSRRDRGTEQWMRDFSQPSSVRQGASDILSKFIGRTSANGLCFRGEMFVFSVCQMATLLDRAEHGVKESDHPQLDAASAAEAVAASAINPHSAASNSNSDTVIAEIPSMLADRYQTQQQAATSAAMTSSSTSDPNDTVERDTVLVNQFLLGGNKQRRNLTLLDIGAGDGGVTRNLAPFFTGTITVTEDNNVMRARLAARFGYSNVYGSADTTTLLLADPPRFDVIALLNVLDRCDKPITLLKEIRQSLLNRKKHRQLNNNENNSNNSLPPLLIMAVVLPWCPFVESGSKQLPPSEKLPMDGGGLCREGASFEQSFDKLVFTVLEPLGFRLRCWTRVPYLSEGDSKTEFFALDDALMVLEAVELP